MSKREKKNMSGSVGILIITRLLLSKNNNNYQMCHNTAENKQIILYEIRDGIITVLIFCSFFSLNQRKNQRKFKAVIIFRQYYFFALIPQSKPFRSTINSNDLQYGARHWWIA